MADRSIFRFHDIDAQQIEQTRKLTDEAREVLRQPRPDTFLGRKTQEPFPKEDELLPLSDGALVSRAE